MLSPFLTISPRITVLPIIHGSGDFAVEVRRVMLAQHFDCVAVPLPPSFQEPVERAIQLLPGISAVVQDESRRSDVSEGWKESNDDDDDDEPRVCSYVPIDPCQGVIAGLRIAIEERIPRAFVDMETAEFLPIAAVLPDPYALKKVSVDKFAAAMLPALGRLPEGQPRMRCVAMAERLRALEARHQSILFICSIIDWPWVREAYVEQTPLAAEDDETEEPEIYSVDPSTLLFLLGEIPHITGLYEKARVDLDDDENLSIDGIKAMLLTARDRYKAELKSRAQPVTPKTLSGYFQYVRNLALMERRMTPDLYTLIVAGQQFFGDQFAIQLAETAREYPFASPPRLPVLAMGAGRGRFPSGDIARMKNRLPGMALTWRTCQLKPKPLRIDQEQWRMRWNPYGQCSWPPEDVAIERFRTHVKDTALAMLGNDLARIEKFSTSLKDGIDIRETLRNWHTGELYVREYPPTRGNLDCVVMLFDSPADPRDYPSRITWHAEHTDESTLALFATDYMQEIVGPGIAQATYGGAMFLFPPRPIRDVWRDRRFDFTDTLEERLVAAACYHSREKHVAILSHAPPGLGWRTLARRYKRKLIHIPLSRFSQSAIQQLRIFHVLNGQQIRSFAAHFIRKA
ncbi:MAG: hypothetical protein AB7O26_15835 [Planctomycetaceae bacterium]